MRSEWNNFSKESDQKKSFVHFLAKISSKRPGTSHKPHGLHKASASWKRALGALPVVLSPGEGGISHTPVGQKHTGSIYLNVGKCSEKNMFIVHRRRHQTTIYLVRVVLESLEPSRMMVESETGTSSKLVQAAPSPGIAFNEKILWTMADYGSPGPPLQRTTHLFRAQ